jgi:DNA-binding transcriptional LysR family regulator
MILNINQLRSFYSAAKHKSVKMAAHELMVTPPAITMQIKQLEDTIGMRLMFRHGNSIRLTEIGGTLFRKARTVFRQIQDMENFLEDASRAKSGILRIGCPAPPSKHIMPRLITHFKKTYPDIKIILTQGSNSDMVKSILEHRNELAVIRQRPDEKRLKVRVFGSEPMLLVAAHRSQTVPSDEISVTQLSNIPLIVTQEGSAQRDVVLEYLERFKVTPFIVMESASLDFVKELVRQDSGASFVVRTAALAGLERKELKAVRILEGSPKLEYGIGYLQRKSLSPAAWAFLRLLDSVEDILPAIQ